jgi:hypothetical protein
MASGHMFSGKKLALISAFAVLLVAAFGAGCKGFFTGNTLQSIAVQPSTVNLQVNEQQQFTAFGTYLDGSRSQITSGLVWSSSDPNVSITSGGLATALVVTASAATITGSAQGFSGTGTVNVIGNVTSMTVKQSASTIKAGSGTPVTFTFAASPGPPDFVTVDNGGTLTITTADAFFVCTVGVDASNNPAESCLASAGAAASYQLQMSYPSPSGGTVNSPVATVTVN